MPRKPEKTSFDAFWKTEQVPEDEMNKRGDRSKRKDKPGQGLVQALRSMNRNLYLHKLQVRIVQIREGQ